MVIYPSGVGGTAQSIKKWDQDRDMILEIDGAAAAM
jgi:hypothetical protein